MKILALHVGLPQVLPSKRGRTPTFTSAIAKTTVAEGVAVALSRTNLDGDYQANRRYHGGPDKALCCYIADHYALWRRTILPELPYGAFGENLTLDGQTESTICIGDIYAIGAVRVQVSQPRQPCVNLVKRWGVKELPEQMLLENATGFYLRVLTPGTLTPGEMLTLEARPHPTWTIARANAVMYGESTTDEDRHALGVLAELSKEWKRMLIRRLENTE